MNKLTVQIKYILFGLFVALLPFILSPSKPIMTLLNMVVVYCIIALGFNILLGYAGQISLGHGVFMGLGAYLSVYLTETLQLPFLLGLLAAGIIPMAIGALLGLVALRLEGHYLAIATLGFGVAIQQIFNEWIPFTNGYDGVNASSPVIFGFEISTRQQYFAMAMIILIILCVFAHNMLRSKTGRALIAMRDSEHAAQAMGISLFRYKLIAFAVSAFYAGIAGSLYAHLIRFVEPSAWGIDLSLNLLAMVVIGGLASIGGAIVGASFIALMPEIIKNIPFLGELKNISYVFTGVLMILIIMFFPSGLSRLAVQARLKLKSFRTEVVKKQTKGGSM
jgi:branched-chain amino acid transport system permease protein